MATNLRNRSLADDLRRRDAPGLASLLADRPDLVTPAPSSVSEVAARAAGAASVRMALHRLDRQSLAVAWAIATVGGVDTSAAAAVLAGDAAAPETGEAGDAAEAWTEGVAQGVAELHRLGLLWFDGTGYHPVRAFAEVVLAGVTDPRPLRPGLVAPVLGDEVAPEVVDRAAGQQGLAAVQVVRELIRRLLETPVGLTREGVVAVRELTCEAERMGSPESTAARWFELAWLAGLVGPSADSATVLPTLAGQVWSTSDAAEAWAVLAQAWWFSDRDWRAFDVEGVTRPHVFGESHVSTLVAAVRRDWVTVAAAAAPGRPVTNAAEVLADRRPMTGVARLAPLVREVALEAELLGVTGRGVLSSFGRALITDAAEIDPADPVAEDIIVAAAGPMLPPEIDRLVVQGDLTIVAPGPLVPRLAAAIASFAEVESTGGATVYRLSVAAVEAALDRGWSAEQILDVLRDASDAPLPQPVEYLVTDTAARHGRIRVGAAASYIRTEDPASLDLALTALARAGVEARKLADTVAISARAPQSLVVAVRQAGVAATAEDATGTVTAGDTAPLVAPPPRPPARVSGVDLGRVRALAVILTAAEVPETDTELPTAPDVERMHSAQVQAVLASALLRGVRVWLRHADNAGADSIHLVTPVHLAGGVFEAIDVARTRHRRFAVSRIVGAVPEPGPGAQ